MHKAQRLINHVALVLDASYSMRGKERAVATVTDEQINHLAKRSEELQQETRISVYRFGETTIECLIFDMDVMRLPRADELYSVLYENTALIDATLKAQSDLATTSQLYGDHAFLTFVLTDGQENRSRHTKVELKNYLQSMEVNWSIGFLVPDRNGVYYMESLGVLSDSVAIWDTTSSRGLLDAGSAISKATDNFMTARASGVRGTRSVFSTGTDAVNKQTVAASLKPLTANDYSLHPVSQSCQIRDFVNNLGLNYRQGMAFYQLTKTETIQPQKQIIVVDKKNNRAFAGQEARNLIGLPNSYARVRPDANPDYDVYVQSTSVNRKLVPGTRVLVRK